jgi:hypothetical protein
MHIPAIVSRPIACVVVADQPMYAQQSYYPVSPRYVDYSGADAQDFAPIAGHPGYMLRPATAPDMGGLPPMLGMAPGGYPRMPTAPSQVSEEHTASQMSKTGRCYQVQSRFVIVSRLRVAHIFMRQ